MNGKTQAVNQIAAELLELLEKHAPAGSEHATQELGNEALLTALFLRLGPFSYSLYLAELMPAKSRS